MAEYLNKLTSGSRLEFEIPFEVLQDSSLTQLTIIDDLVDGLVYRTTDPVTVSFYKLDGTLKDVAVTPVYTTDPAAIPRVNRLTIPLDDMFTDPDFIAAVDQQDVKVIVNVPVTVQDVDQLPTDIDTETNFKYFTNNYQLILEGDEDNPRTPREKAVVLYDKYKFEVYGGSDTVEKANNVPVELIGFFRLIDSNETDNLEYTATINVNPHLDASGVDPATNANYEVRVGNIDGRVLDNADYTLTKAGTTDTVLTYTFNQPASADGQDIFLITTVETRDVESIPDTALYSPIRLSVKYLDGYDKVLGTAGPASIETNIKVDPIKMEKKFLVRL